MNFIDNIYKYSTLLELGSKGWGDEILLGLIVTVSLAICSFFLGLFIGLMIALAKLYGNKISQNIANFYTTIIRGVPELIIIYLIFFGNGRLLLFISDTVGYSGYIEIPNFIVGVVALGLISGSYSSEILRSAIQNIEKGQFESSYALGLDSRYTFKNIIFPQAIVNAIPSLGNIWQLTLKDTALISVIGLAELMSVSRQATNYEQEPFFFFFIASLIFLALTTISSKIQSRIENYYSKGF